MLANTANPASKCEYSQPSPPYAGWISNGGTLTIDAVTGHTFTFTLHAATMIANSAIMANPATGTFSLDGTGTATLP
jgi:hypothetical protein